jgi:hypothetical protein
MTQNVITRHLEMLIRGEATAVYCISIAYESSIRNTIVENKIFAVFIPE